MFWKVLDNCME